MSKLRDGYYTPFGIPFEVTEGVLYAFSHTGGKAKYYPGICKKTDQAAEFLKRRPEMVFKGDDPIVKAKIHDLKTYRQLRTTDV